MARPLQFPPAAGAGFPALVFAVSEPESTGEAERRQSVEGSLARLCFRPTALVGPAGRLIRHAGHAFDLRGRRFGEERRTAVGALHQPAVVARAIRAQLTHDVSRYVCFEVEAAHRSRAAKVEIAECELLWPELEFLFASKGGSRFFD